MSKLIGRLLGVDAEVTARLITRLESICLQPGVDTKLTAEIITKSREKIRSLGLDPADTTIKELYHGLISKAESDDSGLRLNLGISLTLTCGVRNAQRPHLPILQDRDRSY